ncbi:hypothetical protein [Streptomyces sp. NPDC005283]|uniref:hypothetical protein n=1 Tax=Streptomyces sp. NPDC005283 TaxID=3156871 RepID=UPI00345179C6
MIKSLIRRTGRLISAAIDAAGNVLTSDAPAEAIAAEQAGLYEADEMPAVEDIEAAAGQYSKAAELARAGDRGKRAAKKVLDRLPAGRYGAWLVSRVTSNRQTADLDAIRTIFKAHGLGDVPMRQSAPSLKVERLADADETAAAAELVSA